MMAQSELLNHLSVCPVPNLQVRFSIASLLTGNCDQWANYKKKYTSYFANKFAAAAHFGVNDYEKVTYKSPEEPQTPEKSLYIHLFVLGGMEAVRTL